MEEKKVRKKEDRRDVIFSKNGWNCVFHPICSLILLPLSDGICTSALIWMTLCLEWKCFNLGGPAAMVKEMPHDFWDSVIKKWYYFHLVLLPYSAVGLCASIQGVGDWCALRDPRPHEDVAPSFSNSSSRGPATISIRMIKNASRWFPVPGFQSFQPRPHTSRNSCHHCSL